MNVKKMNSRSIGKHLNIMGGLVIIQTFFCTLIFAIIFGIFGYLINQYAIHLGQNKNIPEFLKSYYLILLFSFSGGLIGMLFLHIRNFMVVLLKIIIPLVIISVAWVTVISIY